MKIKTIKKHVVNRTITADEFRAQKNSEPFEEMRQNSKTINFGFQFGASAPTFAKTSLETKWPERKAQDYIEANKLWELKDKIIDKYPRATPFMWKILTCATDIRKKFFQSYPGLMERIERERKFAIQNGYVRSHHGAVRRLPELLLMSTNEKGKPTGLDRSYYGGHIHNLLNIAANTTIQNFEAVLVMQSITKINDFLKEHNMKSYIWNYVHDSIDFALHVDEIDIVLTKAVEICREPYPELLGMPMDVDIVIANLEEGEYYKGGQSVHIPSLLERGAPKLAELVGSV